MSGRFVNTIIFVSNLNKSRVFYRDILGIKVDRDLDSIVFFENHLVLHGAESILNTIFKGSNTEPFGSQGIKNILIYFECNTLRELKKVYANVKDCVEMIHGIEKQEWGQNVFRFYDPDGYIVEFGEQQIESENS